MSAYRLDVPELHRHLDARRTQRAMSWRGVAAETGLYSSTFSRIADGKAPDAHGLVTLLVWLDLDTDIACMIKPEEPK